LLYSDVIRTVTTQLLSSVGKTGESSDTVYSKVNIAKQLKVHEVT